MGGWPLRPKKITSVPVNRVDLFLKNMAQMPERRRYPRFIVRLPFLLSIGNEAVKPEPEVMILLAKDVSKTGLRFASKRRIEPGLPIVAEVVLTGHGPDRGDIHIRGIGRIVRIEDPDETGWYPLAAAFDEMPSSAAAGWSQLAAAIDDPSSSAKNSQDF